MGASESKLVFKQGIFRLYEDKNIPADDPFWLKVTCQMSLVSNCWAFAETNQIVEVLGAA
jgi:High-temperature-induced dauer-formation protein